MDNDFFYSFDKKMQLRLFFEADHWVYINKYLYYLRKEEKYYNKGGFVNKIISLLYCRKKNKLGLKLGFYINKNTIGEDVTIYHNGAIIIHAAAKVGKNCKLHGMNCIGNNGKTNGAPIIGDNVDIGVGASVIGNIQIADNVVIGANSVVVSDCLIEGAVLIGSPAKIKNK